eukprot:scaffold8290_cov38-Cyclotella_meneghiniana.AAC.10
MAITHHHLFLNRKITSCLIDKDDNIFVCYERKRAEGILLYQISFDDNNGESIMNLWYSKLSVGGLPTKHVADRKLLVELCMDACLLMKRRQRQDLPVDWSRTS